MNEPKKSILLIFKNGGNTILLNYLFFKFRQMRSVIYFLCNLLYVPIVSLSLTNEALMCNLLFITFSFSNSLKLITFLNMCKHTLDLSHWILYFQFTNSWIIASLITSRQ